MTAIIIGYALDLIIGDPQNPLHPVRFIGAFAAKLEKILREVFPSMLKLCGIITGVITVSVTFFTAYFITFYAKALNIYFGTIVEAVMIYFCISGKGLVCEGMKVLKYIKIHDIDGARKALSFIVGRDTQSLSEESIIRAVIETIAENISDGIIAPLFFCAIFGAPMAMAYKAVNTMDSMFGYKNDKYMEFGFFPAKLDDVVNYIPARLCGIIIIISAFILKYNYKNSYKIYMRDRYNHTSPNSAHPEAAMAGALGLKLGGPNYYFGRLVEKPYIGDGQKDVNIKDVYRCKNILYASYFIAVIISIIIRISMIHIFQR